MLKTTAGLVVAGAIGVGLGYGASELLRPTAPPGVTTTVTQTGTETVTGTATTGPVTVEEEQRHPMLLGDIIGGQPAWVYTKGGRIIRVTPITYTKDESKP